MVERMGDSLGYDRSSNIGSVVGYISPTVQSGTYRPYNIQALSIDSRYRAEHAWFWGAIGAIFGGLCLGVGGLIAGAAIGGLAGASYEPAHARSSYNLSSKQLENLRSKSPRLAAMYTKAVAYAKAAVAAGCETTDEVAEFVKSKLARDSGVIPDQLEGLVAEMAYEDSDEAEQSGPAARYRSSANVNDAEHTEQQSGAKDGEESPDGESGE